jgi:hypothetical protein
MVEPEAATDVFALKHRTSGFPAYVSSFPVDMAFWTEMTEPAIGNRVATRLTAGEQMGLDLAGSEYGETNNVFDSNIGWHTAASATTGVVSWIWRRAKGFFDVVAYTGSGAGDITHSLGVAPELIIVKNRDANEWWAVQATSLAANQVGFLNDTAAFATNSQFGSGVPTASVFKVGNSGNTSQSGQEYIAFLFATLDGISKVGSYTGNGATSQNIDCGFSNGARFVMIKCTSHSGSWHLMDTLRGIVSGSESHLALDTRTAAESDDFVDPYSAGFAAVSTAGENNAFNRTYIFYAIA